MYFARIFRFPRTVFVVLSFCWLVENWKYPEKPLLILFLYSLVFQYRFAEVPFFHFFLIFRTSCCCDGLWWLEWPVQVYVSLFFFLFLFNSSSLSLCCVSTYCCVLRLCQVWFLDVELFSIANRSTLIVISICSAKLQF